LEDKNEDMRITLKWVSVNLLVTARLDQDSYYWQFLFNISAFYFLIQGNRSVTDLVTTRTKSKSDVIQNKNKLTSKFTSIF